jgi:hypothetical protein
MVYSVDGVIPELSPRAKVGSFATAAKVSHCFFITGDIMLTIFVERRAVLEPVHCLIGIRDLHLSA